jgi:uncharacterized protein YoxC
MSIAMVVLVAVILAITFIQLIVIVRILDRLTSMDATLTTVTKAIQIMTANLSGNGVITKATR